MPPERRSSNRPAIWLAIGLGGVTGGIVGLVFVGWLWMIATAGGFRGDGPGLLVAAGWWGVFWIGLSLGLLGGFALAFRLWGGASRISTARSDAAAKREAVRAAEALIAAARREHSEH